MSNIWSILHKHEHEKQKWSIFVADLVAAAPTGIYWLKKPRGKSRVKVELKSMQSEYSC